MRVQKSFLAAVLCLFLGFSATISLAQQASAEVLAGGLGAGANLVVTSVSGPATAIQNQSISVTYTVENQGTVASGGYYVDLYLSTDKTISPSSERLLKNVKFATGLAPGASRTATSKVLVPLNGLAGNYYYGAVVGTSKKASLKPVSLPRYSWAYNNAAVSDHKTGLVWEPADDGQIRNWDDATQYCDDLVLGGKADWRLPSLNELATIIDYSRSNPAIDPIFTCRSGNYWSSSSLAGYEEGAWFAVFDYGYMDWRTKTQTYYVRCVRGGPW